MKRALSWLLVLVMVFSMVPMAAFADTAVWTGEGSYTVVGGNYYEFAPSKAGKYTIASSDGVLFAVDNGFGFVLASDLESYSTEMQGDGGSIGITPNADTVITITWADPKPVIDWVIYENMDNPSWFVFSPCMEIDENGKYALVCLSEPVNIAGMFGAKYADESTGTYIDYSNALAEYVANAVTIGNKLYTYNTEDIRQMINHLAAYNDWVGRGYITSVDEFFVSGSANHKETHTEKNDYYEYVICDNCGELISSTQPGLLEDNPIAVDLSWEGTVGTASVTAGYWYSFDATEGELFVNDQQWWYEVTDDGRAVTQVWVEAESEGPVTVEIKWVKPDAPEAPEAPEISISGPYKLFMEQVNLGKMLFVTGKMSGYYGATSENPNEGADFFLETSAEGVRIFFMDGETKKYVEIIPSGTYRNVKFNTEPSIYYTYDEEYNTFVTSVEGEDYYLGTYKEFETLSASKYSYISTSFPVHLGVFQVEPEEPDVPDVPVIPETLAEQIAEANKLANKEYLPYESTITGTITDEPQASSYNEGQYKFTVSDGTNSLMCYYVPVTGGTPAKGDAVTVTGYLTAHNGSAQFDSTAAAVVTKATEPEEPEDPDTTGAITIVIADYASENGWENGVQYPTIEKDGITVTAAGGENTGKYYNNGTNWRLYQTEAATVTISADSSIATVKVTYTSSNSGELQLDGVTVTSGETVAVNSNSVTFAMGGTAAKQNGQARITAIEVVLGGSAPSEPIPGESAEDPIYPEWVWNDEYTEATCEVTLGKGTWYFADWTMAGKDLLVNGEAYDYIPGTPRMSPSTWTITNDGAEAVYVLKIVTPVGDQSNPEIIDSLFYSEFTASLAEGDYDGYYYTYIAEGNGTVTFYINNIPEGITGDIVVTNMNTYAQRSLTADGVDNWGLELTVDVSAGDELQIQVMVAPDASWNYPAADITWFGHFTATPGTAENPYFIEDQNYETAAVIEYPVVIPAGETVYFQGRMGGTTLEMDANALTVVIDGVEVNAENGIITYEFAPAEGFFAPANQITVTNNGSEAADVELRFTYAAGSDMNPAELVIGENVAKVGDGGAAYFYNWTAEEDGELTITMQGDNWTFVINNLTTYAYGENHFASDNVTTETVAVNAGDLIQIVIGTEDWTAADISFTASLGDDGACKHTALIHMDAVAPGCHYEGRVEHWYCNDCETVWIDEALTQISNHKSVILPATGEGLLVHMDAVEPGCHFNGNTEYWVCYTCEQVWADEALTQLTNIKNVVVPATNNPEAIHVEAKAPTCSEEGNIEYWYCEECEQVWQDAALTQLTNFKNVKLGLADHSLLIHMDAVAPGCHTNGNSEYWVCYACEKVWADEALTQLTNIKNVILPATHDPEAIHVEAVEPTCFTEGNVEYWYCEECNGYWLDAACTRVTNRLSVKLGALEHGNVVHMDAVAPSCHYNGNIEYWVCYDCEQVWADEALTQLTNIKNVILPATGDDSKLAHFEAVAPSCHYNGNIEYWVCYGCEQVWQDAALTQLTNIKNVVVPATHNPEAIHVEAKAPTCSEEGNIEYWYCEECEQVWQDAALTQLTNFKNVKLGVADHANLVHMDAVEPGCHYEGNIEYWVCYDCEKVWADEALTQLTNIKNVILPATGESEAIHVEAVEPTCYADGNIEYWYCEKCEQVWEDEALTRLSNFKNVKRSGGHNNLVHMDAVEPGCHYDGHIEYWVCYDCEQVWQDAALTQLTNIKNVKIPAKRDVEVIHVPAQEAFCQDGNIEYWYCEECEQVWQDEALTQLTNFKNVIVPGDPDTHNIDPDDFIWSWSADKKNAIAFTHCTGCGEEAVFVADVVAEEPLVAKHEDYNNIETVYNYFTATVTYQGKTYTNKCVVVDPTCRHVGFTSYYGNVLIGETVHNFPAYSKDFVLGSGWAKLEVKNKLAHNWTEKGKPGDADYIKYCVNCNLDYKNVATGDAIMISVIIMVMAAAAVVVMLTKKRRIA